MQLHFHIKGPIIINTHDEGQLKEVLEKLHLLNTKIDQSMADTKAQFDALFARFDAATTQVGLAVTAIGTRITSLEDAVKNLGLPADQEAEILTHTEGIVSSTEALATALTAMGKTPDVPVPPVPEPIPPVQ
jgi:hypothetical protein